jgi:hypothetical protein
MKRNFDIKSLTVGAFLGAAVVLSIAGAVTGDSPVWEYRTMTHTTDATINDMAEQGWSVVGFSEYGGDAGSVIDSYLLRRQKR